MRARCIINRAASASAASAAAFFLSLSLSLVISHSFFRESNPDIAFALVAPRLFSAPDQTVRNSSPSSRLPP